MATGLAGVAALVSIGAGAEGSRTMYPSTYNATGVRASMELRNNGVYAGIVPARQFIYVYAQTGEYILLGSINRTNAAGTGEIKVYDPQVGDFGTKGNETIPVTASFNCSVAQAGSFGGPSLGIVSSRTAELAGPNSADSAVTVTNGWDPCAYKAPKTGVYGVFFGVGVGNATVDGSVTTPLQSVSAAPVWEVAVRATATSVTDLNGRVFTYAWVGFTGGNPRSVYHSLYYVTADGYRYLQTMQGLDPNAYTLYANSSGFLDNGAPLYKDIRGTNQFATTFTAGVVAQLPQDPVFFSNIAPAGPNSAEVNRVLGALGIPTTPPTPTLSSVSFVGNQGGSTSTQGAGGTFQFTTANTVSYQIVISRDGVDFDPATTTNRVITGLAASGLHTVYWDGIDNAGANFPASATPYKYRVTGRNGEIHFPIIDTEGNLNGGPTMTKLNGNIDSIVYYDDRGYTLSSGTTVGTLNGKLCGAASAQVSPSPDHSLAGADSSNANFGGSGKYYRFWTAGGNSNADCSNVATEAFGDAKGLDLWAFASTGDIQQTLTIIVQPLTVDLATIVTVDATAYPGQTVYGTLVYRNDGTGSTASGVTYTAKIGTAGNCPTAVTFSLVPTGVSTSYNTSTCIVTFTGMPATLTAGQELDFHFSYPAPATGPIPVNTTIGGVAETVGAVAPNSASGSTVIIAADVSPSISVPASAAPASTVSGTITFANLGTATAQADGVTYSATIGTAGSCPAGVTFPSPPAGVTVTYDSTSCQLTFSGMPTSLAIGASQVINFQYTAPASGTVPVTAAMTTSTTQSNTANDTASASTGILPPADLRLIKSGPAAVLANGNVVYNLVITNLGPNAANNATFSDTLPGGTTFVSANCNTPVLATTCSAITNIAGTVSGTLPTLPNGGGITVTITVTAPNAILTLNNTATVTPPATVSDPVPANNTSTANTSVETIDAVNDNFGTVNGAVTANVGNVLLNDTLNGATATTGTVTISVVTPSGNAGVTLNTATGAMSVAAGTPAGTYNITYQICDTANPTICDTATASVVVGTIDAVNDTFGTVNGASTTTVGNVVTNNDTLNGAAATVAGVNITVVTPSGNAGVTLNTATGAMGVTAGTPSGTYTITYQICDKANPTFCDTATATVVVVNIDAVNDTFGTVNGAVTTNVGNVVTNNDTLNGVAATVAGVNITVVTGSGNAGVTLNTTTGVMAVAAGTPAGTYSITYQICDKANPTVCDTAIASVVVGTIDAVNDTFGTVNGASTTTVGNVVTNNDTLNGAAATVAGVNITVVTPSGNAGVTLNTATGAMAVAAGTPSGTYTITYQICDKANPTFCDTATATVVVANIDAVNDNFGTANGASTTTVGNVVTNNDTLNGAAATVAGVNLSVVTPASNPGVTLNNATGAMSVAAGTPSGTYTITYQICDKANPTFCDTATATVVVANIDAVNDNLGTVGGTAGSANAGNVLGNDTLDGSTATTGTVTISVVTPATNPGVSLNTATGIVSVAPGTPGGTYTITYKICDIAAPTLCDTATITIVVDTIDAVDDTYASVNGNLGNASVGNVLPNDTLNGVTATTATVTISVVTPASNVGVSLNTSTGVVSVAAGTPAGNYTITYKICDKANPTVCDTALVTVPVNTPTADLSISKTDNSATYTPGGSISYTIVVSNAGPSDVIGASVIDSLPANITAPIWICAGTGTCFSPSGTGDINTLVDLPSGTSVTFTVSGSIPLTATGSLDNTATVTPPADTTDPVPGNNSSTDTDTSQPYADIGIVKTVNNAAPLVGNNVVYTVTATNYGPSNASGVQVTDSLPAGLSLVSAVPSAGTTYSPATGVWTIGNLADGANATLVITATVNVAGAINNQATVTAQNEPDPDPSNNFTGVPVNAGASADIQVLKTASNATPGVGSSVTFTIQVTNAGPSAATAVQITDLLPTGLSFVSAAASTGTYLPGSGVWTIGAMPNGDVQTLAITATVTQPAPILNSAKKTGGNEFDPVPDNNQSGTEVNGQSADVQVTKAVDNTAPQVNQNVTFTITAKNDGPSNATNVVVTDLLPAGLNFVSAVPSQGAYAPGTGIWTVGNLSFSGPGSTATLSITAKVVAVGTIVNTATKTGETEPDPNPFNDTDTATLGAIPVADLSVVKSNGATSVIAGQNTVYTLAVTNSGPSAATGAVLKDIAAAGLNKLSVACSATPGACTLGTTPSVGQLEAGYALPALANGQSYAIDVTAKVTATGGSVSNTAVVTSPPGTVDPDPSDDSSTDTDTVTPSADLSITKTDGVITATAGGSLTYTITASNAGPSAANNATVTDTFPAAFTVTGWTCTGAGGGTCTASGTGNINDTVNLPVGGSVTYLVNGTVGASAVGTLVNTANVTVPPGFNDPNPANNSATDSDNLVGQADLHITKTDGSATYTPGTAVNYGITVSNPGPSNAPGSHIVDNFPAGYTGTWTCSGTGGGTCTASGSGSINDLANLPVGASVTYLVSGSVSAANTGNLTNTANVTPPAGVTDPNPGDNSATDDDAPVPKADLAITKTDGVITATPGGSVTYTITASNAGPSNVVGATVADTFPGTLTGTWTCVGAGGGTCTASGSGNINASVNIPAGGSVTFTVTATIASTATGNLTNTATVTVPPGTTDPTPGNNSATDTDTLAPQADLSMTKTDGSATYTPGGNVTYTLTASNAGPSAVTGAGVTDTFPAGFTGTWTCVGAGGGTCTASGSGNIATAVTLPVGGSVTFTVTGTVSASKTGNLVNTASIAPPAGTTDPTPGNNSATDTDTQASQSNLSITKTDGNPSYVPGAGITYTITVSNAGPSDAIGATVADTLPAAITSVSWGCVSGGGNTCTASGSGNINDTVTIKAGSSIVYTLSGLVDNNFAGTLANTATVTAPPGTTDPTPGDNSATDTDSGNAQSHLVVVKTDGSAIYTPGTTAVYTVTVTNTGPSTATGVTVTDALPAGVTLAGTPTCVATGIGSLCGSISGAANDPVFTATSASVDALPGSSLIYSVPVKFDSGLTTASLQNIVTAKAPSSPDASGSDTDTRTPQTNLTLSKTDGSSTYTPGGSATYIVTVGNTGPSDALGSTLSDTLPSGVTLSAAATCVASSGASCGLFNGGAIGGNSVSTSSALVPVGETLTFVIPVNFAANLLADPLTNTATVNATGNGSPVSASDSDTRSAVSGLTIAKTDGSTTYTPGNDAVYTITVSNAGPTDANAVTVSDTLPSGVTISATPTCVSNGTATCGTLTGAVGTGTFSVAGAQVPAGDNVVYSVPVHFAANLTAPTLANSATASDPSDPNPHTVTDTDTLAAVTHLTVDKDDASLTYTPGGTAIYVVSIGNSGPSDAQDVSLADTLPAGVTLNGTVACAATGSAVCGNVSGVSGGSTASMSNGSIAAGAGNMLQISVPVAFGAGLTIDPLINTATATDPGDPNPENGSDSDVRKASSGLTVTKDDGSTTYTPGGIATYNIVVTNAGPSNANALSVTDNLPPGVTLIGAPAITCTTAGIASCGTLGGVAGGTTFTATGATLAAGVANSLTYHVNVSFASSMQDSPLANSVKVSDPSDPVEHTGTDSDTRAPDVVLTVGKDDGATTYVPGGTAVYTLTVLNTGVTDANAVTASDSLPAGVSFNGTPTCASNGAGANCGSLNVAGTTLTLTGGKIPAGAGRSLVLSVPVKFASDLFATPLTNSVTVSDPDGTGDTASDSDTPAPSADTNIAKSVSPGVVGGGPITYTLVITNAGPSSADGATYNDPMPAGITGVTATCGSASGGATCGTGPMVSGSGPFTVSGTVPVLPPSGTLTITISGTAPSGATQMLVNTATLTNPPGTPDPNPIDNTSTTTISTPVSLQSFEVD
jgi:uncharacterized repeat protein (TIGR01451 family)